MTSYLSFGESTHRRKHHDFGLHFSCRKHQLQGASKLKMETLKEKLTDHHHWLRQTFMPVLVLVGVWICLWTLQGWKSSHFDRKQKTSEQSDIIVWQCGMLSDRRELQEVTRVKSIKLPKYHQLFDIPGSLQSCSQWSWLPVPENWRCSECSEFKNLSWQGDTTGIKHLTLSDPANCQRLRWSKEQRQSRWVAYLHGWVKDYTWPKWWCGNTVTACANLIPAPKRCGFNQHNGFNVFNSWKW